jgi:inner membrane protein
MDPISQGAFGAIFAQTISSRKKYMAVALLGCIAGFSPDLDVLIRSSSDPLLKLEFHRQFTHSLVFIPFGALIVTLLTRFIFKKYLDFSTSFFVCFIGYATHGLLDACTSYGTQLFWPFTNERISWNNISVVDPFLTIPILTFIILTIIKRKKWISILGLTYIFLYLGIGFFQNNRAETAGKTLAKERGHQGMRLTVKPSLGNLILWKTIYEDNGYYYVDAVRLLSEVENCPGTKIKKLNVASDFPNLKQNSQQFKDIKRFHWFSEEYLGLANDKNVITDVRYSAVPNEIDGLWGIKIDPLKNNNQHVEWVVNRSEYKAKLNKFLDLLLGKNCIKEIN